MQAVTLYLQNDRKFHTIWSKHVIFSYNLGNLAKLI